MLLGGTEAFTVSCELSCEDRLLKPNNSLCLEV